MGHAFVLCVCHTSERIWERIDRDGTTPTLIDVCQAYNAPGAPLVSIFSPDLTLHLHSSLQQS